MTIGEFEYDSVFNSDADAILYPYSAHIVFVIFVIIMSILIMNLLVSVSHALVTMATVVFSIQYS